MQVLILANGKDIEVFTSTGYVGYYIPNTFENKKIMGYYQSKCQLFDIISDETFDRFQEVCKLLEEDVVEEDITLRDIEKLVKVMTGRSYIPTDLRFISDKSEFYAAMTTWYKVIDGEAASDLLSSTEDAIEAARTFAGEHQTDGEEYEYHRTMMDLFNDRETYEKHLKTK